jgi:hypothetical protein
MEMVQKKLPKANDFPPPWGFTEQSSDATKVLHIEAAMRTACEALAWVFGSNFTAQTKVALAAASHEVLILHRHQFTPARIIALYHSIIADFFRRIHLQVRDWSSDQRYGIEIPPEGSEEVGHISMLYYRNGQLPLQEVWGPETVAASLHANKAFTSVQNCSDSKPGKPSADVNEETQGGESKPPYPADLHTGSKSKPHAKVRTTPGFHEGFRDAYKLYAFLGMGSIMSKERINPMVMVPRFERN